TWPWWKCEPMPQSKERDWKPATYSKRACPRPYLHGGRRVTGVPTVAAARMRHERTASWRSVGCHREIWTPPAQFSGWPSRITQTHWRWGGGVAPRPGGRCRLPCERPSCGGRKTTCGLREDKAGRGGFL